MNKQQQTRSWTRSIGHVPDMVRIALALVVHYEAKRGRIVDVRRGGAFDLRSVSPPDASGARPIRRIAVKARAAQGAVHLTPAEWRAAARLREAAWLYIVREAATGRPRLQRIRDPWARMGAARR
ncbi:MAG: DUF3883 domain-containing protein [Deltaproteobacteria bacterium]|nr:DUF3883 domain-containing protein [Deltaproteobacteria bacterium]